MEVYFQNQMDEDGNLRLNSNQTSLLSSALKHPAVSRTNSPPLSEPTSPGLSVAAKADKKTVVRQEKELLVKKRTIRKSTNSSLSSNAPQAPNFYDPISLT